MKNKIYLSPEHHACLIDHAPPKVRAILETAPRIDGIINMPTEYALECNEDLTRLLLEAARQHCPEAVPGIKRDIRQSQPGRA